MFDDKREGLSILHGIFGMIVISLFTLLPVGTRSYLDYRKSKEDVDSCWRDQVPTHSLYFYQLGSIGVALILLLYDESRFQGWMELSIFYGISLLLGFIFLCDLWMGLIPNSANMCLFAIAFINQMIEVRPNTVWEYQLAVITIVVFMGIAWLTQAIGWGDVKLLGIMMLLLGIWHWFVAFGIAVGSACIWVVFRAWISHASVYTQKISFGTHLSVATVVTLLAGEQLWEYYLSFILLIY